MPITLQNAHAFAQCQCFKNCENASRFGWSAPSPNWASGTKLKARSYSAAARRNFLFCGFIHRFERTLAFWSRATVVTGTTRRAFGRLNRQKSRVRQGVHKIIQVNQEIVVCHWLRIWIAVVIAGREAIYVQNWQITLWIHLFSASQKIVPKLFSV